MCIRDSILKSIQSLLVIEELVEIKSIPFIRYLLISSGFIPETSIIKFLLTSFFKLLIDKSLNSWTLFLIVSGLSSSNKTLSAPDNTDYFDCSIFSASIIIWVVKGEFIRMFFTALLRLSVHAIWFSFIIAASYNPILWLTPPPHLNAYFSNILKPGVVFLAVSYTHLTLPTITGV